MDFVVGKMSLVHKSDGERLANETKEINIWSVANEIRENDVNAVESRSRCGSSEKCNEGKELHFVASNVIQRPKKEAKRGKQKIVAHK